MDLQFFGGSGAPSGRRGGGGNETPQLLQPSPELDKIQPESELKQRIEDFFNKVVKKFEKYLGTEKDLKLLEDKLHEMTNSDEVYVGIRFDPKNLEKILEDGRFKSQFETGTSGGVLDNWIRSNVESGLMGYSDSIDPVKRPIYGMLFDGKTPSDINLSDGDASISSRYGKAVAIFKRDVKQYSTVTFGDSLDGGTLYPSPLLKPSRYSITGGLMPIKSVQDIAKKGKMRPSGFSEYVEVQIHGGHATTSNIDRIVFARDTPKESIPVDKLKAHGIKWSIEK